MSESLSHKILTSFKQMVAGTGIKTLLSIVSGYLYALILGPAVFCVWQTARVFINYGTFINLGTPFIIQRDYPSLMAEGKSAEAKRIAQLGMSLCFITFPLVTLITLIIAFIFHGDILFRNSLIAVALWFIVTIPAGIGTIMNKAVNDYKTVGIAEAIFGIGSMAIVPLIYWYGFNALLAGFLFITAIQSIYYFQHRPVKYHWLWESTMLRKMIFAAFPIFLVSVASSVFASIDRLIIASMLSFESVGLYSLSTFIASPISLAVSSFSLVLFTQLNARYGRSTEPHVIEKHVFIPQSVFSNMLPPLIGMALIALPLFTQVFLPKYNGGIAAAQINIFAIFFYLLAGFSANALFVLNKQKLSALSFLVAGIIKSFGSYFGIKAGFGIEAVAIASVVGYFVYDSLMLYFVHKNIGHSVSEFLVRLVKKTWVAFYILIFSVLYVKYHEAGFGYLGISNKWLQLVLGEGLILLISFTFIRKSYTEVRSLIKK